MTEHLSSEPAWFIAAACRDLPTEMFFPGQGEDVRPARAVCRTCPVSFDCLSYALRNDEHHGIWGGTTERQRRNWRRIVPTQTNTNSFVTNMLRQARSS